MSGIGSLLSVARTAMQVQQAAVSVAGHNIANAQTAGYSRQTVDMSARPAELRPQGAIGTGVTITGITRARDALLDAQVRASNANADGATARGDILSSLQGVLGDGTTDASLAGIIDQFYNSWSDLANNPSSAAARANVRERGQLLATTFNNLANQVDGIGKVATERASALVDQVNQLARQVAALNAQIISGDAISGSANDLKDARDRLIDQLSSIVPVTVTDMANGANRVNINGISLVDGSASQPMAILPGSTFRVAIAGSPDAMRFTEGTLGQTMVAITTDIPAAKNAIDALAGAIVTDVNAIHRTGWSPAAGGAGNWNPAAGPTGSQVDFFDASATGLTARGMALSTAVQGSPNAVAAGATLNGPGDNTVALALADLRRASPSAVGGDAQSAMRTIVHDVAVKVSDAKNDATVHDTLRSQATDRRNGATAVSTDEEMTNLMKYQQAYIAAARLVTVADELAQSVLGLIR